MEHDRQKLESNAPFHFSVFLISVCMLSLVSLTSGGHPDTHYYSSCNAKSLNIDWDRHEFLSNLLSALNSNATRETGFYNATFGEKLTGMAYGCFLCRGDVEADVCAQCVNGATRMAVQSCPYSKRVVWWYGEYCMLRYSDESLFSVVQYLSTFIDTPVFLQPVPPVNATTSDQPTGFNQVMESILNELVTEASKASAKFATKEAP